jgi:arylsulfatase A-like enzyme
VPRSWIIALVLFVVAGAGWLVVDRTLLDDEPVKKTEVHLPTDPIDDGKDEPDEVRVHVDNSGDTVSVSIRTPRKAFAEQVEVDLNGSTYTLSRDPAKTGADAVCEHRMTTDAGSLITRLDVPRTCIDDSASVTAKVSVDGGKPITATAKKSERPNVLMIMVDDMRQDDLAYMPNVQKFIAKQGVTFTNGFASFPLCCPARASVVTGQYPHNHGVWSHDAPWGFSSLDDHDTVPVWLQAAGYHTTYLGKYLNGYGTEPKPGLDSGTSTDYCPAGWDLWRGSIDGGLPNDHPDNGGTYRYFDTTLNDNCDGYVSLAGRYQTAAYTRLTREQLKANAEEGKPFFSYVSFTAPHHGIPHEPDDPRDMKTPARPKRIRGAFDDVITQAPGADWNDPDRSDKPKMMRGTYDDDMRDQMLETTRQRAEALYLVDESVKKIVKALERNGQLDNTLVVFTSDNGYFLGEQGLPQGKIWPYEPSLRVPVLMRGPGLPKGEVRTDPFLSIDYAPTFADLADSGEHAGVDGVSLLDVARLGDEVAGGAFQRVVLTETMPTRAAAAELAKTQPVGARQTSMMLGKVTGIRTSHYLYTEWQPEPGEKKPGVLVELYDVTKDPDEYVNLAVGPDRDEELLAAFHELLGRARTCVGVDCRYLQLPPELR